MTADDFRDAKNQVKGATIELTAKAQRTVAIASENFENFEEIKVSRGGNTFLFGNDYWGGGSALMLRRRRESARRSESHALDRCRRGPLMSRISSLVKPSTRRQ